MRRAAPLLIMHYAFRIPHFTLSGSFFFALLTNK